MKFQRMPHIYNGVTGNYMNYNELSKEMAKQANLGHTQFCIGVHDWEDEFGYRVEEEWIAWDDAFKLLENALEKQIREKADNVRQYIMDYSI